MRIIALFALAAAFALPQAPSAPKPCTPRENVQFICGVISPEALVPVPGSDWVIASGDAAGGTITLINIRDKTTTALFPTASPKLKLDAKTYDSCPGPIDPEEKDRFRAHGLALRPGRSSMHTLYVV